MQLLPEDGGVGLHAWKEKMMTATKVLFQKFVAHKSRGPLKSCSQGNDDNDQDLSKNHATDVVMLT